MTELRTELSVVSEGGRVSVIDNTLWPANEEQPCATVRVTLSRERAVEVPGFAEPDQRGRRSHAVSGAYPAGGAWPALVHGAMEAREGDGVAWFRLHHAIIDGAGPLSSVLGPADWTHGIARPVQDVVADPNPNLTVQLFRQPEGEWVGIRAEARWRPAGGLGVGSGVLLDVHGEIGRVSMSVILVPFPQPNPRPKPTGPEPAPASN